VAKSKVRVEKLLDEMERLEDKESSILSPADLTQLVEQLVLLSLLASDGGLDISPPPFQSHKSNHRLSNRKGPKRNAKRPQRRFHSLERRKLESPI